MHRFLTATAVVLIVLQAPVSYAEDELPAMLIRIPESVNTIFVAETTTANFHRFERAGDSLVKSGSYYMSIGQQGAGKERSGDKRTPLGAYFVTEQLDTSRLHEKYGITAFPLDYPNEWDRLADRDGDGIWVHGVLRHVGQRPPLDTDGCIALSNEDLIALIPNFAENVTPVLVTREVRWVDSIDQEHLRGELEASVAAWATSKERGDLHSYLSLYDKDFSRWGMNKAEWSALSLRTRNRERKVITSAAVSDLLLIAYPEEEGVYLSRFRLTVIDDDSETVMMTRLYWRRDDSGVFRIVAESRG
jgi:murein L,D-transpeptidase YafK